MVVPQDHGTGIGLQSLSNDVANSSPCLVDGASGKEGIFNQNALAVQIEPAEMLFAQAVQTGFEVIYDGLRLTQRDLRPAVRQRSPPPDLKCGSELGRLRAAEALYRLQGGK